MALNHEVPDRIPYQATFTPEFADRLRKELNINNPNPHDPHSGRWNTYELEIATGETRASVFNWVGYRLLYGHQTLCR